MKAAVLSLALVVVALAVIVPIAQGLQCYVCLSGDGAENMPGYHKKCKEGKLPDDVAKTCIVKDLINPQTRMPYNSTELEIKAKQGTQFACGKVTGKAGGKEANVKICTFADPRGDYCDQAEEQGVTGTVCVCHGDKCNGAVSLNVKSATLFATVATVFMRIAL